MEGTLMDDKQARERCTAQSKQTRQRCRRWPTPGSHLCRMHGGRTPAGVAAPTFKHGRYSKQLPSRLAARYAEAATDPRLLELREDVALLDSRIADVLQRVDSGESGSLWRRLQAAHRVFPEARRRNDMSAMRMALDDLLALIAQGATPTREPGTR